MMIFSVAGIL